MLMKMPFYKACDNVDAIAETLKISAGKLFKWFKDNQMKYNTDRFHLILSRGDSNQIKLGNSLIKGILYEKFLGVKFDHKVAFDQNVKIICKKATVKLKVLARVVPYIVLVKKNLPMNSFFFCAVRLLPANIDDS